MICGLIIFFSGLLALLMVRKHFFMSLICLEFLLISLFYILFFFFSFFEYDYYFSIMFLVLGVCDGVIGLSLLVYIVRKSSNDYLDNLIMC